MVKINDEWIRQAEIAYPGFRKTLNRYESMCLPGCPACQSTHTASVQMGIVGRSISLAAATTRIKLVTNPPVSGQFFCNDCETFFD
ncbi:MAG: hypothetical protein IT353_22215 [Gemmatimonadaceae bacterium]|nr:hypothetical protein [Gemmatimonadaceae bacterium]